MELHGGNIYKLQREGKKSILDYSSNINPLGIPKKFKEKVIEEFDILERYPDPDYVKLRENIGVYNNTKINNIVVGNGATEILFLYIKALSPKKAVIVAPTFAEYARALNSIGCEIVYYELNEENEFRIDIKTFISSLSECDLVILCNPNNPTGIFLSLDEIKELNAELKRKSIKLFLDEAFIEFIKDWKKDTALNLKDENIFIMRALTKFFAIPGLRLGYGMTFDEVLLEKIKEYKEPWSVNGFADLAGQIMLWDREYIEKSEKWIEEEKEWFYKELLKIDKIKVFKTTTNFILIKLLKGTSKEIKEKMVEKGILVRDAANFRGLNNKFIRLAIKSRENNKIVSRVLAEILEKDI